MEQSIEKAKQKKRVADSYQPNWGSDDKRQAETARINRHQRGIPEPKLGLVRRAQPAEVARGFSATSMDSELHGFAVDGGHKREQGTKGDEGSISFIRWSIDSFINSLVSR